MKANALAVSGRRPQTDADRGALTQAALTYIKMNTTGVRTADVRLLASSDGESFVLVPVEERKAPPPVGGAPAGAVPLEDPLCVYASGPSLPPVDVFCWSLNPGYPRRSRRRGVPQSADRPGARRARTATLVSVGGTALSAPVQSNFFDIPLPAGSPPPLNPTVTLGGS